MSDSFSEFKYVDTMPFQLRLRRLLWMVCWFLLFRFTPRFGFNRWRVAILVLFGAKIGKGSRVSASCFVWAPWNLEMGELSALGDGVDCYSMGLIKIGSKVAVSQRTFLCTGTHDISTLLRPLVIRGIEIRDHVWVCAECFVGPGVVIGDGSVIAARSCVVNDVPPWKVYGGNPARLIKDRVIKNV